MDWVKAIEYAELVAQAYRIPPGNLTNSAGIRLTAGGRGYTVITTIYASDLATDLNPQRGLDLVSMGLVCQADETGEVAIALRGTEGMPEWIHDAEYFLVPCPFLAEAGWTEDGFTDIYVTLRTTVAQGSPTLVEALDRLDFPRPTTSLTICGHSLGGALATLLALDVAAHTRFADPTVYTYASPRTGNPTFASTYKRLVKNTYRIANRIDLVPNLPVPPVFEHVEANYELSSVQFLPPRLLVKLELVCGHSLNSYLYLMSLLAGGQVQPLEASCSPW